MTSPRRALELLRAALDSGDLDHAVEKLGVGALTVFGSAADPDRSDPVVAVHALRGEGLWEASAGLLAEARIRAELEWMDTRWLRQLELARLRG